MTNQQQLNHEYMEQKDILCDADEIVLYGNTVVAPILRVALLALGITASCRLFDQGQFVDGELGEDNQSIKRAVLLCGLRESTRRSMSKDAAEYFPRVPVYDFWAVYFAWVTQIAKRECDYEILAQTISLCREDRAIPNIDTINTTYCNLNCKECNNGIQYRKERRHIKAESQIKYLDKITALMPITICNFQGGEVFMDRNFTKFLLAHAKNPRLAVLTVATNGAIMPDDNCFRAMKTTGAMLRISDYGVLSKCKEQIMKKSSEYDIPCFTYPRAENWRRMGEFKQRGRGDDELKTVCASCYFGTKDMMFLENKLFCCLRTLFGDGAGYDNEAIRANMLDLDTDFSRQELEDVVCGHNLYKMCDYCDSPMEIIAPAEQMPRLFEDL